MTDQTVPVPVDLLKRLKERYPADVILSNNPIAELHAFIPTPPKVGDKVTADQAFDLPVRSTLVDDDDDVYVVYGTGKIRRVTNYFFPDSNAWEEWEADRAGLAWSDLTITSIPAGD